MGQGIFSPSSVCHIISSMDITPLSSLLLNFLFICSAMDISPIKSVTKLPFFIYSLDISPCQACYKISSIFSIFIFSDIIYRYYMVYQKPIKGDMDITPPSIKSATKFPFYLFCYRYHIHMSQN